jgi:integrase
VLAGFSGLRVGEVAGLRWSDIDLAKGFVCVSRTVEEDEDKSLVEYPPKNGKARVVPSAARSAGVWSRDRRARATPAPA